MYLVCLFVRIFFAAVVVSLLSFSVFFCVCVLIGSMGEIDFLLLFVVCLLIVFFFFLVSVPPLKNLRICNFFSI